jgi:hypothetical protein
LLKFRFITLNKVNKNKSSRIVATYNQYLTYYFELIFEQQANAPIFAFQKREFSSAGSEHLPYKQRVTGSNPVTPTEAFGYHPEAL